MKKIMLWSVLLFSILLAACGRAAPTPRPLPSPVPLPTPQKIQNLAGKWTVILRLSGGIAGLSRSIEISSDGAATAKDERSNKSVKRQLTSDELTKLTSLINSSSLKAPTGLPSACADCFNYNIQISSDSGKFAAQLDDISLPDSGMELLAGYMGKLMNQMLAGG